MKLSAKKRRHYNALVKFFVFAQISCLVVAAVIVVIVLLPNNFKQQHKDYTNCIDQHQNVSEQELKSICPKPYK